MTAQRARELGMAIVRQGVADKGAALREILAEPRASPPHEVAYIGRRRQRPARHREVGLSAAPADAPFEVRAARPSWSRTRAAAAGCLREFLEAILRARGDWDRVLAQRRTGWPSA